MRIKRGWVTVLLHRPWVSTVWQEFKLFNRSLGFHCLTGFFSGCRDSWWCAGHGLWHFHQDCTEVPASLCAGASWGGHALHRGDSQWYQHHHLWSTATAGRKGQGVYKGDQELSWKLKLPFAGCVWLFFARGTAVCWRCSGCQRQTAKHKLSALEVRFSWLKHYLFTNQTLNWLKPSCQCIFYSFSIDMAHGASLLGASLMEPAALLSVSCAV